MRRNSLTFARFAPTCVAVLLATATAGIAHAQPTRVDQPARGAASLERAHAAWNRGDFDTAETLFKEALDQGGLAQADVLDANVFLGAARGVVGHREPALVAFRQAALMDPHFKVPPEAGKKVAQLADVARRQTSRIGPLVMKTEMPSHVTSGQPFQVSVSLDPGHAAILTRVGLKVTDSTSPKTYSYEESASSSIHFTVPASVTLPDASLTVKLVGLDSRDNEYVSAEGKVAVDPAKKRPVAASSTIDVYAEAKGGSKDKTTNGKGGFFSTPWPYVIGGVLLAGAGAGVYFFTRPADNVSVSQTHVQAIR